MYKWTPLSSVELSGPDDQKETSLKVPGSAQDNQTIKFELTVDDGKENGKDKDTVTVVANIDTGEKNTPSCEVGFHYDIEKNKCVPDAKENKIIKSDSDSNKENVAPLQ